MCQKCVCEGPRPDIFLRKMRRWPTGTREDAPHHSSPGRRKTTARQPLAPGNTGFVTRAGMTSRGGGRGARTPCCWGRSRARPLRTTPRRLLHALSTRPPRGPEIPWLGIHPERRKSRTRRGACVRTCTAAWLAAEETWKPTIGRRSAMHGRRSRVCDGVERPRGHRAKCERGRQIPCDPPRLRARLRKRTHDPTARDSLSR